MMASMSEEPKTKKPPAVPVWVWILVGVLALGLISSALNAGETTATDSPSATESDDSGPTEMAVEETEVVESEQPEVDVPWEDYDASVKLKIDELAAQNDCEGLQEQFDISDANSEATMSRTGHSNAQLMAYIDQKLQAASCY
jgi:hypothetical protein